MRPHAERVFVWAVFLSGVAFALSVVGALRVVTGWLPWVFLASALGSVVVLAAETGALRFVDNRLRRHVVGWAIATVAAAVLWSFGEDVIAALLPILEPLEDFWEVLNGFGLYFAGLFGVFAAALVVVGSADHEAGRPEPIEHMLVNNLTAKIGSIPMVLTAIGIFVGCTLWTVAHSFTNSRLLPKFDWAEIGFQQYEILWDTNRWMVSIKNLFIYGVCSMTLSIVLGFLLAALLDQKIRFENTFRTILLYPFALSFIVTGLVWQWILNPEFGIEKIVRDLGFAGFRFDPLYTADVAIYGVLIAGLWQGTGLIMVLMLAGLRGIDEDIWKAARVDGIPTWKTYVVVIIPMMRPVFITTLVIIASGIVRVYDLVVAQTGGGPGIASEVPAKYVYDRMFLSQNLGQGFAASTMMLLTVLIVLVPWAYLEFGGRKRHA